MFSRIVAWCVASTWFKKWSGQIGAYLLGWLTLENYGQQIYATLAIWGVDKDGVINSIILVVGASGVLASIGFSLVKSERERAAVRWELEDTAGLPQAGTDGAESGKGAIP